METLGCFKQVRLVGGNLALDFVNTETGPRDGPPDSDALESYEDLRTWSRQAGAIGDLQFGALATSGREVPKEAAAALRDAVRLRSQLRELFTALARKQEPDPGLLGLLRDHWARSLGHAQLARAEESFAWDWSDCMDLKAPLWSLVNAAVDLVQSPALNDVKQCDGCCFLFVDTSKAGSRRWCSMDDCGKTAKMRRYVDRRRTAGRSIGRD